MEGMSEEQKEYEAMQLVEKLDKLQRWMTCDFKEILYDIIFKWTTDRYCPQPNPSCLDVLWILNYVTLMLPQGMTN